MRTRKTIALSGPRRAGKDLSADILGEHTTLRRPPSTSYYLAAHVAPILGVTPEEAFARRHESEDMRQLFFETGNKIRAVEPLVLVKPALAAGDILIGCRDGDELIRAKEEGLLDLIVWISRDVPDDPTLTYGPELCDVIVANNGDVSELTAKLVRFAAFAGLLKG